MRSISLGPQRTPSPVGVSIAQRHAQYAEQTTVSAISGVGRIAEETHRVRGVVKAAIAEATSVHGAVKSRVALLVAHAEASTVHMVSELSKCIADAVGHTQE